MKDKGQGAFSSCGIVLLYGKEYHRFPTSQWPQLCFVTTLSCQGAQEFFFSFREDWLYLRSKRMLLGGQPSHKCRNWVSEMLRFLSGSGI